jgi:RNA-splicing ligase RtcB
MGTLGSGNHYLEVQVVTEIFDAMTEKRSNFRLTTSS